MNGMGVDALLILGGEDRELFPRCGTALQFYRDCSNQGLTPPKLIVSGGVWVLYRQQRVMESALMASYLVSHGVPAHDVLTEPRALNTFGNIVLGGELAAQHGLYRLAIVTDNFHQWRSRQIFRQVFGAVPAAAFYTGVHGSWRTQLRERLTYLTLRLALRLAGVRRGNFNEHKLFLANITGPVFRRGAANLNR